jgi:hypothetical protein
LHRAELHLSAPIAGAATTAGITRTRLRASCARLGRTALRATIAQLIGASAIAHSTESAGRPLCG